MCAAKSIIKIEVDDSDFQAFQKKYEAYQQALEKQPAAWSNANKEVQEISNTFDEAAASFNQIYDKAQGNNLKDPFDKVNKSSSGIQKSWHNISRDLEKSHKSLSGLSGLAVGLKATGGIAAALMGAGATAFGVMALGMNSLAAVNKSSRALGLKPGQQQAFNDVYEPAGGSTELLAKMASAKADPTQWRYLQAAGISPEEIKSKDATSLATEFMEKAGHKFTSMGASGGMWAQSMGITNFMDPNSLRLAGSYSSNDYQKFQKQYEETSKKTAVDQAAADAATEFTKAMKSTTDELKNNFFKNLTPLAPEFKVLMADTVKLADTFEKASVSTIKDLIHAFEHPQVGKPNEQYPNTVVGGLRKVGDFLWGLVDADRPGVRHDVQEHPAPYDPNYLGWNAKPSADASTTDKFSDIEKANKLPSGLMNSVAKIESNNNPNAVGPMTKYGWQAQGEFQLSPDVIKKYGVSDPMDEMQSAGAAAKELHSLLDRYKNNVAMALAAYNWGQGNVDKDIAKHGADWQKFLPTETKNYLKSAQQAGLNINVSVSAPAGSSTNVTTGALTQ